MHAETIEHRLSAFARDRLGCLVAIVDKDAWLGFPLPGHFRFGWMPPVQVSDPKAKNGLLVLFSPRLIAEVTAHLTFDEIDSYLTIIEFVLARHVAQAGRPVEEINNEIEVELYETNPEALTMRYEAEARALGTIVPLGQEG